MNSVKISVIIPTHDRLDSLAKTLECLKHQDLPCDDYEIIVVDDGSKPPVCLRDQTQGPKCSLLRLEGVERSGARNRGAAVAEGELLVFVDDDMTVCRDFLKAHLSAQSEWPGALVVGGVRLPDQALTTAFGRFRQKLEQSSLPRSRGLTSMPNLCTAANMSIPRESFLSLGGFDGSLASGEDQDFALRHTACGGQTAFIPDEAEAIHKDSALDIKSYCRRAEWGSEQMIRFCRRHPDWPDNVERERINGPVRLGLEPLLQSARKLAKLCLTVRPVLAALFLAASALERVAPNSRVLDRTYRLLLGPHILRGYRAGLERHHSTAITVNIAADHATR